MSRRGRLSPLARHHIEASMAGVSRVNRLPAEGAIVERVLLWAFIAGLAWCPFWFGSNRPARLGN